MRSTIDCGYERIDSKVLELCVRLHALGHKETMEIANRYIDFLESLFVGKAARYSFHYKNARGYSDMRKKMLDYNLDRGRVCQPLAMSVIGCFDNSKFHNKTGLDKYCETEEGKRKNIVADKERCVESEELFTEEWSRSFFLDDGCTTLVADDIIEEKLRKAYNIDIPNPMFYTENSDYWSNMIVFQIPDTRDGQDRYVGQLKISLRRYCISEEFYEVLDRFKQFASDLNILYGNVNAVITCQTRGSERAYNTVQGREYEMFPNLDMFASFVYLPYAGWGKLLSRKTFGLIEDKRELEKVFNIEYMENGSVWLISKKDIQKLDLNDLKRIKKALICVLYPRSIEVNVSNLVKWRHMLNRTNRFRRIGYNIPFLDDEFVVKDGVWLYNMEKDIDRQYIKDNFPEFDFDGGFEINHFRDK